MTTPSLPGRSEHPNRMGSYPVPEVVIEERNGHVHISLNFVDAQALAVALHAFDSVAVTLKHHAPQLGPQARLSTPMILLRGILDRKLVGAPGRGSGKTGTPQPGATREELLALRKARRQELWTQLWYEDHPGDATGAGHIPAMPTELES